MIQDVAWSPRLVGTTTATAATAADVTAGTSASTFITPAALAGSSPTLGGNLTVSGVVNADADGTNLVFRTFGSTPKSAIWTNNDGTMTWGDYATGTKSIKLNTTNGNATLSGNLTVSGTGTSSVAGDFSIGAGSASIFTGRIVGSGGTSFIALGTATGNIPAINGYLSGFTGTTNLTLQNYGGNLLIGTTTDGGQKLQVAGAAYIGSATTTTNSLTVQGNGPNTTHQAGTSTAALWNRWLNSAGTRRGYYGYANSGDSTFTIMNEEAGSFVLGTNGTAFLTGDSSQNATFANGLVAGKAASVNSITGGDGGAGTSIIQFKDSSGTAKVNITGDGKLILSGVLRLNNTYTAGAPTATGYVTIQDSTGTTYKVLVGT